MCSSICLLAAVLLPDLTVVQLVSTLLVVPQRDGFFNRLLLFWQCCSAREVQGGVHTNRNFRTAQPILSSVPLRLHYALYFIHISVF